MLAQHNYSPVHILTATDEQIKEFLRMRDDHKLALKKIKQQILAFCLRHNYRYDGNSHWTAAHLCWLKSLQPEALYKETLDTESVSTAVDSNSASMDESFLDISANGMTIRVTEQTSGFLLKKVLGVLAHVE